MMFLEKVYANPYSETCSYGVNCTWYAWKMAQERAGVTLPAWGNAKEWYNDAIKSGYSVGTTPKANSIVVWENKSEYGHVGYVDKVVGDKIYVYDSTSYMNGGSVKDEEAYKQCILNGVSEETDKACFENAEKGACPYPINDSYYIITGYIYLDSVPTTKTNTNTSTNTQTVVKEETTSVVTKSNNNNLSSITLSVGEIEFNKDVTSYSMEVDSNTDKVKIDATTEDEKATTAGLGEYDLNYGYNAFILTVKAEDESTKNYTINIKRNEEKDVETTPEVVSTENTIQKDNTVINILYGICIVSFIVGITSCIIYLVKNKNTTDKKSKKIVQ